VLGSPSLLQISLCLIESFVGRLRIVQVFITHKEIALVITQLVILVLRFYIDILKRYVLKLDDFSEAFIRVFDLVNSADHCCLYWLCSFLYSGYCCFYLVITVFDLLLYASKILAYSHYLVKVMF
jgi:hypothetical protein